MTCLGGHVNNGHVVDTRHHEHPPTRHIPGCWLLERNKTFPTSSFSIFPCPCPENWRRRKNNPSRLPCPRRFPTHLVHDRPAAKNPLLSSPLLTHHPNNRRAPMNICIPSLIPSSAYTCCTPAGGQPSTADHSLGVQPWRLPALDTAAAAALSKTRGSGLDGDDDGVESMPAREVRKKSGQSPPTPRRYHDIFWGRDGGVAGDIICQKQHHAWPGMGIQITKRPATPSAVPRWMPGTGDADSLQDLLAFRRRRHIIAFPSRHVHRPVPSLTSSSDSKRRVSSAPLPRRHPPPRRGRRRRRRT